MLLPAAPRGRVCRARTSRRSRARMWSSWWSRCMRRYRARLTATSLSRPGAMLTVDVACALGAAHAPCRQAALLRQLLRLNELRVLRVTAKYVVARVALPASSEATPPTEEDHAHDAWVATLQLSVALHERATPKAVAPMVAELHAAAFALGHLQTGLIAARSRRDGSRRMETIETARESDCHVVGCVLHDGEELRARFQVQDVFQQLMAYDRLDGTTAVASAEKRPKQSRHVKDLPSAGLRLLVDLLTAREVAVLSCVCRSFNLLTCEIVPGLDLQLFSHQKRALRWLLYRESASRRLTSVPHPFMFPSVYPPNENHDSDEEQEEEETYVIDLIDERLRAMRNVTPVTDIRGGLFCDEPGLGKTITMLALILRTKGQRSDPRELDEENRHATRTKRLSTRLSAHGREVETSSLLPSAATLIIVPRLLLDHWRFQISTHVASNCLDVHLDDLDCKDDLPPAATLAEHDVVITSFERLNQHWKHHKPRSASELNRPAKYGFEDAQELFVDGFENRGTSALLRIHWARIVVDEGHKLGGKRMSNHMCMAELLHASKRWVMTGTPTPTLHNGEDLRHLHGLLRFLRERPYGDRDGKAWLKGIARPFEANDRDGYERLLRLLQRIMLRHTKASILKQIPSPTRHVVLVDATPHEQAAYNGIVTGIRLNLVTNRADPSADSDKLNRNSLMHAANRGHVRNALRNLRNATCSGGSVHVTLRQEDFDETIEMLSEGGVPRERLAEVEAYLKSAVGTNVRLPCPQCARTFHALVLVPCGHFVCADCADTRFESHGLSCGECGAGFEWKAFQEIQPGVEIKVHEETWRYNGEALFVKPPRQKKKDKTPLPPGPKPKPAPREFIAIDYARFSAVTASKTNYVTRRIAGLLDDFDAATTRHGRRADAFSQSHNGHSDAPACPTVPKVIVFSQLQDSIFKTKIALSHHDIPSEDYLAYMPAAARTAALVAFRNNPQSNVLLLSDAGSHGLDLSFVTHIFFMEESMDASLETQVIARAHRMGARQSVVVEKLLMRGSLDEYVHASRRQKRRDRQREEQASDSEDDEADDGERGSEGLYRRLLRDLRTIDDAHAAAFGFLRFQVRTEDGAIVRADTVRLPNPGDPLPEPVVTKFIARRGAEEQQSQRVQTEAVTHGSQDQRQQEAVPTAESLETESGHHPRKHDEAVWIKSEPALANNLVQQVGHHQVAPELIDLTSDTDDDETDEDIEVIPIESDDDDGGSQQEETEEEGCEYDDWETDDEWMEANA